jgi:hypothetical protein
VHALDDGAHALERPQISGKSVLGGALQDGRPHAGQLRRTKLGLSPLLRHGPQRINAALIEQCLPCVHDLPRNSHGLGRFCSPLARQQDSPSSQAPLCRFAQSLLHYAHALQYRAWKHNVREAQRLPCI